MHDPGRTARTSAGAVAAGARADRARSRASADPRRRPAGRRDGSGRGFACGPRDRGGRWAWRDARASPMEAASVHARRATTEQLGLALVARQRRRRARTRRALRRCGRASQQVAAHAGQQVVVAQRAARRRSASTTLQPRLRPVGHRDGDRAIEFDHRRGACARRARRTAPAMRGQSVSCAVRRARMARGDRGLQRIRARGAAEAFGALAAPPARAGCSRRSQRARSWSSSRIGVPSGSMRAPTREACNSISASRPCTSGSPRREPARMRPRRKASSHSAGRIQSSPLVAA